MEQQPLISIIVPVYNMEKYLRKCVDSLLEQTLNEIEVICVNDCSTDSSLSILKEYEEKDNRMVVIDLKQNVKQGGARNRGIEKAKAPYLCFVDSDDWLDPKMCEDLYHIAIEKDADMVRGGVYQFYGDNDIRKEKGTEAVLNMSSLLDRNRYYIAYGGRLWGGIVKKEIFLKNELTYPEHLFYEDNAIGVLIYLFCKKIAYSDKCYYYYRCNNQSTTRSTNNYRYFDRLDTAKMFLENMRRYGFYETYKEEVNFYFITLFYINTVMGAMLNFDPPATKYISQVVREMKTIIPHFRQNRYYKKNCSVKMRLFHQLLSLNVPLTVCLCVMIIKCKHLVRK